MIGHHIGASVEQSLYAISHLFSKSVSWLLTFRRPESWAIEKLSPGPKATGSWSKHRPAYQILHSFHPAKALFKRVRETRILSLQELFLGSCLNMNHYFPFSFEPCFSAIKRFIIAGCFLPAKSIELNYKHRLAFCYCSYLLMGGCILVSILSEQMHLNWEDIEGGGGRYFIAGCKWEANDAYIRNMSLVPDGLRNRRQK